MDSDDIKNSIFDVNQYTTSGDIFWFGYLSFKNGKEDFCICEEDENEDNSWFYSFTQTEDGVEFCGYKISTMDEFLACCCFLHCNKNLDKYSVPLIITTFLLLADKISIHEFLQKMKDDLENNRKFIQFDLKMLDKILNDSTSTTSQDKLGYKLLKYFEIVLNPDVLFSDWNVEYYIKCSKENRQLSDAKSFLFGVWFLANPKYSVDFFYSNIAKKYLPGDGSFPNIPKDNILYLKEINKWRNILSNELYCSIKDWRTSNHRAFIHSFYDLFVNNNYEEDPDLRNELDTEDFVNIGNGLLTGNIFDIFPDDFPDVFVFSNYYFEGKKDEVIIPSTEEKVKNKKYSNCYGLKSVIISEGVKSIGKQAFMNCFDLENIVLPETVIEIEPFAFDGCEKLSVISIPKSVIKIGLTTRTDMLLYAINNNLLGDCSEKDIYTCLENCIFANNIEVIKTLSLNNLIPEQFHDFPTVDLIRDAVNADSPDILDIFFQSGLRPEFGDYSQFIIFASNYNKSKALSWLKGEWNISNEPSEQKPDNRSDFREGKGGNNDSVNQGNNTYIRELNTDNNQSSGSIIDSKVSWIHAQTLEVASNGCASAYFFFDLRNELAMGNYDWQNDEFLHTYSKFFPEMSIDNMRQLRLQAIPWINEPNTCNTQYQIIMQDSFEHRFIMIAYAWFERAVNYEPTQRVQFVYNLCNQFFHQDELQNVWERLCNEAGL